MVSFFNLSLVTGGKVKHEIVTFMYSEFYMNLVFKNNFLIE